MNTVGIFAGRGDVIIAMGLSVVMGMMIGWQARRIYDWAKQKFIKEETT